MTTETASRSVLLHSLARFFGVVVSGRAWLRLVWLALAFPIGLALFVYLSVGLSLGAGLAITLVGLPLLVLVLLSARALAVLDQRFARAALGAEVAPAPWLARGARPGFWPRLGANLADGFTWRGLLYLLFRFPLGIVAFTVVVTCGALVVALLAVPFAYQVTELQVFGGTVTSFGEAALCFVAGLLLLPLALHAVNGAGWALARLTAWWLQPGREATAPPVETAVATA